MCNNARNSNGSQFLITTKACPELDGKNVAFGVVREGLSVLRQIEGCVGDDGRMDQKVKIEDCGQL